MSKLFESLCKLTGNELAQSADKGVIAGDVAGFVDTGSYSLNILISGRAYGGYPIGRVTGLAGDPAAGKSFACLTAAKEFLNSNENAAVFYFESEGAVTKDIIESFGIDLNRFYVVPVTTVQEFRTCAVKVLDGYLESGKDRPPMLFVLDSLGMLSTTKEMEDTATGSETKDMTRNQIIKATFRVLTLKMALAKVAMIMTTHTYACLAGGQLVRTANGLKSLANVEKGDQVWTTEGLQSVVSTYKYENVRTVKLTMEDGEVIYCSPNHKFFYVPTQEWVEVGNFAPGMDIRQIQ